MTNFNIWVGLAAWTTNHAYTFGNKVSAGGNAYQCIQSGTSAGSGSGPTGTGQSIIDNSVLWKFLSTIDYSGATGDVAFTAATAGLTDPLTQNVNWYIGNNGPITTSAVGTSFLNMTIANTSAFYLNIQPLPGNGIRDALKVAQSPFAFNANAGVSFILPSSGVGGINYFQINANNVVFTGLQFQDPNSSSGSTIIGSFQDKLIIQDCIFSGYGQAGGATILGFSTNGLITNSLIIDNVPQNSNTSFTSAIGCGQGTKMINSAIIAPNVPGSNTIVVSPNNPSSFDSGGANANVINCMIFGYGNSTFSSTGSKIFVQNTMLDTPIFPNNGSAVDGGNNIFGAIKNNQFVNGNTDFRLVATSGALNKGLTESSIISTSDDIAYTLRPQGSAWDLGPWEFKSQTGHLIPMVFKTFII